MNKSYLLFPILAMCLGTLYAQLSPVSQDGKWGLVDKKGTFVVQPKYEELFSYKRKYFIFQENNLWGFMNEKGEIISPAIYDLIEDEILPESPSLSVFESRENEGLDEWGFGGTDYKALIKKQLDDWGYISVRKSGKKGFLNAKGEENSPFIFDEITEWAMAKRYRVRMGEKYGLVDTAFQFVVNPEYQYLMATVEGYILYKENNLWGFIDRDGKILMPATYKITLSTDEYDPNWTIFPSEYKTNSTDEWGFGGDFGEYEEEAMFALEEKQIEQSFYQREYFMAEKEGEMGLINGKGEEISPFIFESISPFMTYPKLFRVKVAGKYGLVDKDFHYILPASFDFLALWGDKKTKQIIVANAQTNEVILKPKDWDFLSNQHFPTNWRYDLYSLDGKKMTAASYEMISNLEKNNQKSSYAKVQLANQLGLISKEGEAMTPVIYETILPREIVGKPVFLVQKKGLYGYLAENGQEIIPAEYTSIAKFEYDKDSVAVALAQKNGKFGAIDVKGKVLIPFKYENLSCVDKNRFLYTNKNHKLFYIDTKGKKTAVKKGILISEPKNWE